MSFKSFYASDIHGSEMLWRKFINAAGFYGVEVLIMGGDVAGKAVVPDAFMWLRESHAVAFTT